MCVVMYTEDSKKVSASAHFSYGRTLHSIYLTRADKCPSYTLLSRNIDYSCVGGSSWAHRMLEIRMIMVYTSQGTICQ